VPSVLQNIAIDSANPYELAQFWSLVTGAPVDADSRPGDPEVIVELPSGPVLYFAQVAERKITKNRVHVCLSPNGPRDVEVDLLLGLGAALVADHRQPDGSGWVVLGDPEGNEFCVLRSPAERHSGP
jgi:hypothetical protein